MSRFSVDALPPQALLLGSITSVQFGSAFADTLFKDAGPGGVVLLRLALGAIVLTAIVRPSVRGKTWADWWPVIGYGLVLGTMNWTFYECLHRLPLGVAVTIEFTGPLVVAVAGSRKAIDLLWVALAAGGVLLLAGRGDHSEITVAGVVLALCAAICWAGYILVSKPVGRRWATLDALAVALCIGSLVPIPAGVIEGGTHIFEPHVLLGGLAVAVLSSLLPYSLELTALRRLSTATFGLLMSLEPAVAALAGVLVLGQSLSAVLAIALVMVVAASVGTTLTGRRRDRADAEQVGVGS